MIMKATTDYSLLIMIETAKADGVISSAELSKATGISQKYLKRIAVRLKDAGLIVSVHGLRGGYSLSRPASEISAWDILSAVENSEEFIESREDGARENSGMSNPIVDHLYKGMNQLLKKHFESISLADLIQTEVPQMGGIL